MCAGDCFVTVAPRNVPKVKSMPKAKGARHAAVRSNGKPYPPGRMKIAKSFITLLEKKEFTAITTAEIARKAGVTEALIYKYFKDKRDLLHRVLHEYLDQYLLQGERDLEGVEGALNKLRTLIGSHLDVYSTHRVFAKILLLEVRSHADYYKSETYGLVKRYSGAVLEIIEEGIRSGEIRDDISPVLIRQVILGSIEHVCLNGVIFDRELAPGALMEDLCRAIFTGIESSGAKRKR